MNLHPNEVDFTNIVDLTKAIASANELGPNYLLALKEQARRQGVTLFKKD